MRISTIVFILLITLSNGNAQNSIEQILAQSQDSIDFATINDSQAIISLPMSYASFEWRSIDLEMMQNVDIHQVDLVYTAHHHPTYNQYALNKHRLEQLQKIAPHLFNNPIIDWKIIAQKACKEANQGNQYFHGFILHYTPQEHSVETEIDWIEQRLRKGYPPTHPQAEQKNTVYRWVDRMPNISEVHKRRYFNKSLEYPKAALKQGKEGTVLVTMIIDSSGKVQHPELMRGFDSECDQEALRLVREMPDWSPGMEGDELVNVRLSFPVVFKLPAGLQAQPAAPIYYDAWERENQLLKPKDNPFSTQGQRIIDQQVFAKIIQRQPWTDIALIVDLTASMAPYTSQWLAWYRDAEKQDRTQIQHFTFFNDGDRKEQADKWIGSTGGIYQAPASGFSKVKEKTFEVMKKGRGGDLPENNIEAALAAIEACPTCKQFLLVVDNYASPRDLALLNEVTQPLRVVVCGASRGVHPCFLDIARKTGGSLHTQEYDCMHLNKLKEGDEILIGHLKYQLVDNHFQWIKD